MIIKRKRIKAKGPALKRILKHLRDGDDNDLVELIQGNVADLEDARQDALRLGREYGVRHWILSPESDLSAAQLAYLLALLATEFGFDHKQAVVWKHTKARASDVSSEHYHVLVREVDAVSGRVLSSAHDFKKHEKLSRMAEVNWGMGHRLTPGAHNHAVAHFLAGGENDHVATAMVDAGLLKADRPTESFTEADQQRAKRQGLDLPRLAILVSEALTNSTSKADFDIRLAAIGLRLRPGEKPDTPVIETFDQELVGSLARLTRLRKKALQQRMKFDGPSSAATDFGPQEAAGRAIAAADQPSFGNASPTPFADCQANARGGVSDPVECAGPAGSVRDSSSITSTSDRRNGPDVEQAGKSGDPDGRTSGRERDAVVRAGLVFALGCAENQNVLLDLLGVARRCALSPIERVTGDLDEAIEQATALINRVFAVQEPATLAAARQAAKASKDIVRKLEGRENEIIHKLAAIPAPTLWRRIWHRREAKERATLNTRLAEQRASLRQAENKNATAQRSLIEEETAFRLVRIKRSAEAEREKERARLLIPIASAAKILVLQNPHFALRGSSRLIEMAATIETEKAQALDHATEEEAYSLRG